MYGGNRYLLRTLLMFFVGVCCLRVQAQTSPAQTSPGASQSAPVDATDRTSSSHLLANSNAKLGIGDLIDVTVYGVPDLSTKARVSGSGDIYLPLIDYVHVSDLTTDEAQDLIQKRLEAGGFVRSPHVSIYVNEAASQSITLLGEVARPGSYAPIGERRLFDVISAAGGLTEKAGRNVTIEHRSGQKVELQLSSNLAEDTQNNVEIQPGDTIIVSKAGVVYVVGDVNHPSGFLIEDSNLSVLKALALAGGSTKTSALSRTRILRQTPNGIKEIPINLKKVLYAKAPDQPLVKGDILFVPGSAGKAAAYRTADAAMSLSTSLAIIAVDH